MLPAEGCIEDPSSPRRVPTLSSCGVCMNSSSKTAQDAVMLGADGAVWSALALVATSTAVPVVNDQLVRDLSSLKLGDEPPLDMLQKDSPLSLAFEPRSVRLPCDLVPAPLPTGCQPII